MRRNSKKQTRPLKCSAFSHHRPHRPHRPHRRHRRRRRHDRHYLPTVLIARARSTPGLSLGESLHRTDAASGPPTAHGGPTQAGGRSSSRATFSATNIVLLRAATASVTTSTSSRSHGAAPRGLAASSGPPMTSGAPSAMATRSLIHARAGALRTVLPHAVHSTSEAWQPGW